MADIPDPTILHISQKRCALLAVVTAIPGLILLPLVAYPLWLGITHFLIFAGLIGAAIIFGFCIFYTGLALRKPVALRMDHKGISGYYFSAASWDEIKSIKGYPGQKSTYFLGFELFDPIAFRTRQNAFGRLRSWMVRGNGVHLVVPDALLKDPNLQDFVPIAQAYKDAHDAAPHTSVT